MNTDLALSVDGVTENPRQFAFPDMSLSSARSSMTKHEFSLHVQASAVAALMAKPYAHWVAESQRDDEMSGTHQDLLAESNYPSLDVLLTKPALVELVFGGYLMQELFGPMVWDRSCDIKYWYDQTTSSNVTGEAIEIKGVCYSRPET